MKIHHLVQVEYTLFCKMAQFWNKQIISVNIYIVDSANNAKGKAPVNKFIIFFKK